MGVLYFQFWKMSELLKCLVCVSEKAANIARACRREPELFALLVEEKVGEDKNAKFSQDFKTLADVLIQETVRYDVGRSFPHLKGHIFGEESNKFTNKLGESVTLELDDDKEKTLEVLIKVLNGNNLAAGLLTEKVFENISIDEAKIDLSSVKEADTNLEDVALWIDPIDATSQYIKGGMEEVDEENLPTKGLKVVTVLIGVFSKTTGLPILGVVNQPFSTKASWTVHWGCNIGDSKL